MQLQVLVQDGEVQVMDAAKAVTVEVAALK
jgi:hypothetical protein